MPQDKLVDAIATTVAAVVGVESTDVTPDRTLASLEIDSLAMVEVVVSLEDKFGLLISDDEWSRFSTIWDVATYLEKQSVGAYA